MKVFRIFFRSIRNAFQSVFRNFSLSLASISCTAITLVIVALAILVTYNVNSVTTDIENTFSIVVFIDSSATEEQIDSLKNNLLNIENVDASSVKYSSKEDIAKEVSENDETISSVLEILGDDNNPIEPTYTVYVNDIKQIDKTADEIKKLDNVESISYGENLVNKIVSSFEVIRNACLIAVIALIVVTAFLITNTIKITIFSRRNEINIMRLVGTSNTVISLPFLFEGFILGLIGTVLPVLITIYGYTFVYDFIGGKLFTNMIVLVNPNEIIYKTSLILVIVGGIVGMLASVNAVRKYLKI